MSVAAVGEQLQCTCDHMERVARRHRVQYRTSLHTDIKTCAAREQHMQKSYRASRTQQEPLPDLARTRGFYFQIKKSVFFLWEQVWREIPISLNAFGSSL